MATTRTKSILTIAILLVVLAVLSAASALTQFGFRVRPGTGFNGNVSPNGNTQGGGNFQGGNDGGFQGGNGGGGNGGNFQGGSGPGGFQARGGGFGGLNLFGVTRSPGINPQIVGYINIGATVLGILLALLCAYGVWKQKKWALNLSMALAFLFLLTAIPGVLSLGSILTGRGFNLLRTAIPIVSACASAVIIFLGILPSVRETVS